MIFFPSSLSGPGLVIMLHADSQQCARVTPGASLTCFERILLSFHSSVTLTKHGPDFYFLALCSPGVLSLSRSPSVSFSSLRELILPFPPSSGS